VEIPIEKERYVVVKGDTLYSISKKYNIPIEELKRQNNLFENAISIGQSILIEK
jgi:LysM repeat protein